MAIKTGAIVAQRYKRRSCSNKQQNLARILLLIKLLPMYALLYFFLFIAEPTTAMAIINKVNTETEIRHFPRPCPWPGPLLSPRPHSTTAVDVLHSVFTESVVILLDTKVTFIKFDPSHSLIFFFIAQLLLTGIISSSCQFTHSALTRLARGPVVRAN